MNTNGHESERDELGQAVIAAAGREDVCRAIGQIYAYLAQEIEKRRPVCLMSGRCCRFEEYGHRLFVTTMELAAFVAALRESWSNSGDIVWDGQGCPFQVGKSCGVHAIRPFGCRVFFCDETAQGWQEDQYERFHMELRSLHEQMNVPYFYVEWREALRRTLELEAGGR